MTHKEAQDVINKVITSINARLSARCSVIMAKVLLRELVEYEKPVTLDDLYERHHYNATEVARRYGFNRGTVNKHLKRGTVNRIVEWDGKHYLLSNNEPGKRGDNFKR